MKKTKDYDNTFKSLKVKHKRLFITCINEAFNKNYPLNAKVEVLPSEGFIVNQLEDGAKEIEEKDNDFLIRIENDCYLIECQSYDDDSMALRMAEYSFLAARQNATWSQEYAYIKFPHYSVIYLKNSKKTPRKTKVCYEFPDGQKVEYSENNIFLENITKEEIVEKRLFIYIPFYIIRYEKELSTEKNYEKAIEDLEFLYEGMLQWKNNNEITDDELADLSDCVRIVVKHITDGNDIEGEVVGTMGGKVIELASDRIRREVMEEANVKIEEAKAEAEEAKVVAEEATAEAEKYRRILMENGIEID